MRRSSIADADRVAQLGRGVEVGLAGDGDHERLVDGCRRDRELELVITVPAHADMPTIPGAEPAETSQHASSSFGVLPALQRPTARSSSALFIFERPRMPLRRASS